MLPMQALHFGKPSSDIPSPVTHLPLKLYFSAKLQIQFNRATSAFTESCPLASPSWFWPSSVATQAE